MKHETSGILYPECLLPQSLLIRVKFSPEFSLKKRELGFVGVAEVELMDRRWS